MGSPVISKPRKSHDGKRDVTILASFAVNEQQQPVAVDIGDLQPRPFEKAQATGVDRDEAGAVDGKADTVENAVDFIAGKNDGEFLLALGADEVEQVPLLRERLFEEELDAAQGDGEAGTGVVFYVCEVEEVGAQILFGEKVGRLVEVGGECPDGMQVRLLGPCGEAPKLHILGHALSKRRHGVSFLGGGWDRPIEQSAP